mmetsp:Transcript_99497/g.186988  ORF Transcript_99497/g.186988 Transcript_99497/m.186988 type:complete len:303 (-) Transcript_99497:123-1031(-)
MAARPVPAMQASSGIHGFFGAAGGGADGSGDADGVEVSASADAELPKTFAPVSAARGNDAPSPRRIKLKSFATSESDICKTIGSTTRLGTKNSASQREMNPTPGAAHNASQLAAFGRTTCAAQRMQKSNNIPASEDGKGMDCAKNKRRSKISITMMLPSDAAVRAAPAMAEPNFDSPLSAEASGSCAINTSPILQRLPSPLSSSSPCSALSLLPLRPAELMLVSGAWWSSGLLSVSATGSERGLPAEPELMVVGTDRGPKRFGVAGCNDAELRPPTGPETPGMKAADCFASVCDCMELRTRA